ncbi:MAG: hypothetical protein DRH08_03155 [Deltaproteobacteria bacterium]|nr:MAG: hypothetical protein DRH08_03155 [Deltaproteobacteria bacterium]
MNIPKNPRPINVAFDIDDTIWKINEPMRRQEPDYKLINVLLWFVENGDNVFVWSAGGQDYAKMITAKLGIDQYVKVIHKSDVGVLDKRIDLCFDDAEVGLAHTTVLVHRKHNEKENYEKYKGYWAKDKREKASSDRDSRDT